MKSFLRLSRGLQLQCSRLLPLPSRALWTKSHSTDGYLYRAQHCFPWQLVSHRYYSLPSEGATPATAKEATVLNKLQQIERSLIFHGYSVLRIGAAVIVGSGFGLYFFREHVRENVADEVSTVASRSLGDEAVKQKAEELSKALLHAILSDEQIQEQAVLFLQDIFNKPGTRDAVITLLSNVLSNPDAQRKLLITLKQLIARSFSDPTFRRNLAHNLKYLFDDENTKQGMASLVSYVLENEEFKETAKVFSRDILASESVKGQAVDLGRSVVHGIVSDVNVQKKTGDGLWSAFGYSVMPSWTWFGFGNSQAGGAGTPQADSTQDKTPNNSD